MKTPLVYYGGKQMMARHILPLIQDHQTYVEPFCGGAAVFFAKDPSPVEVLNDLNGELMNFYRICQTDFENLETLIRSTLHSRDAHRQAKVVYNNPDMFPELKRAWALWVLSAQGFAGKLGHGWGYDIKERKTSLAVDNKKKGFTGEYSERLERCQLDCKEALEVIRTYDTPGTLFYVDPPYFNSDCGMYKGYGKDDYQRLLELLSTIKGKFILSSYPSDVLDQFISAHGWNVQTFGCQVSVNNKSGSSKKKTEVLAWNYNNDKGKAG